MPTNYEWISSSPDLEFLGPTTSREIQLVTVMTTPESVVFSMPFGPTEWGATTVAQTMTRLSSGFIHAAQNPHVVAVWATNEVNEANQQVYLVHFTISSSSGKTQRDYSTGYAIIEPPQDPSAGWISDDYVAQRVAALDAVENA